MTRPTNLLPCVYNLLFAFTVFCGFTALLFVSPLSVNTTQAQTQIFGPEQATVSTSSSYSSGQIDLSGYKNIDFSFDYDSSELDNQESDSFTYEFFVDGSSVQSNTIDGETGLGGETGTVALGTSTLQGASTTQLDVSVSANTDTDVVELTNVTVSGDKKETEEQETQDPGTSQCATPQTKGDSGAESVTIGNKDYEKLWDVFDAEKQQGDGDFGQIDTKTEVNSEQTQTQFFETLKDSSQVKVTYIRHEKEHQLSARSNVIGWYEQGATSTFTSLFEHRDHSGHSATPGTDGATKTFTANGDFGFAIKSEAPDESNKYSAYSENDFNHEGSQDRVVIYRLDTDKYALGFEDLYAKYNSDTDFEDMTVLVEITGCTDEEGDSEEDNLTAGGGGSGGAALLSRPSNDGDDDDDDDGGEVAGAQDTNESDEEPEDEDGEVRGEQTEDVSDEELQRLLDEARNALVDLLDDLEEPTTPTFPNTGDGSLSGQIGFGK